MRHLVTTKVGGAESASTGEWTLDGRPQTLFEQASKPAAGATAGARLSSSD